MGAVLVIGIFTGLAITVYSSYSKAASRNEETETLSSLLKSFLQLKEGMEKMENGTTLILPFKLNVGGKTGGTLWVSGPPAGRMGFTSQGLDIGDLSLVVEGGGLFRVSGGSAEMLSPPALLRISEVREENMVRWVRVDVRLCLFENRVFQLAANSPVSLRFVCTSDEYSIYPEGGRPNRERVVLSLENWVSPNTRQAWRKYLEYLVSVFPPYYGLSLDPTKLELTVEGFDDTPGVKDILYYERYTRIGVGVV